MAEFLLTVWSIGFTMTLVAQGLRDLVDAVSDLRRVRRGEPALVPTKSFADVTADIVRAVLWPLYLWRPW